MLILQYCFSVVVFCNSLNYGINNSVVNFFDIHVLACGILVKQQNYVLF